MIKKLLLSIAIIGVVGGTAFAGTRALLSDAVTLTANTFSTGTVDLQIAIGKSAGPAFADTQVGFTKTMFPGQTETKFFRLRNNGTGVDLSIVAQASSASGAISPADVTVAITPVNSTDVPTGATASATLATWVSTPGSISPPNIGPSSTQRYQMDVSISSGVTTGGVSSVFDFNFTGTQVP